MSVQQQQPLNAADIAELRRGLNDFSAAACGKHVTIYGWSGSVPGSERWITAETLGRALAEHGYGIVTGGYCGTMEALSKGAREVAAVHATTTPPKPFPNGLPTKHFDSDNTAAVPVRGILVPGQFPDRTLVGNPYLTESVDASNLLNRLDVLSSLTRYYIVLPGTLGTLTELCIIWSLAVLHKKDAPRPVILAWRNPWEAAVKACGGITAIPDDHMNAIQYVDSVDECIHIIETDFARHIA